ncbi:Mth938-like domain-containing protein [Ammonifex thiophilus]|uniref:Uncharacterized protein n=1 Tax=Ammonifex thiophilus TaxID=444093 RepID=A0A3D8P605_9THEO|nr:Mth938-like domain-containing protein [Ammonifex thiophilus]RDV83947.1 hypothetical protein DXX99_03685 [Ammonifex thiophilus]
MRVDKYSFGEVIVEGKTYHQDILIFPDRVLSWWRQRGHEVALSDLTEALKVHPEVLVIGTGAYGVVRVLPEVKSSLAERGIDLIALPTAEACRKYNELLAQGKRVVAALHLTC